MRACSLTRRAALPAFRNVTQTRLSLLFRLNGKRVITDLQVDDLAVIEHARLSLERGLTVLTGETGAGKSLLIDAIGLALGARADSDLVRSGKRRATVAIQVDLRNRPDLIARLANFEIDPHEGTLVIEREVNAEGRSTARANGKMVTVAVLREIGGWLVDLHGQHDHQALLDPDRQLEFLDDWLGEGIVDERETMRDAFARYEEARERVRRLQQGTREREQRIDLLKFQVEEIGAVSPVAGEFEELTQRLHQLQHAAELRAAAGRILDRLDGDEISIRGLVAESESDLDHAARLDSSLESVAEDLNSAQVHLEEVQRALSHYLDSVEADPKRLEDTAARLDALTRLRRKYGESEAEVLAYLQQAEEELAALEGEDGDLETAMASLEAAEARLQTAAQALHAVREAGAREFQRAVEAQLQELAMDRAEFEVSLTAVPPSATGIDAATFLFTANPGEPKRPLHKVASGGELSRTMLAIKVAGAGRAGVPTLIFDEVDAGLSGRAASRVAAKMEQLALHYQVLAISHLPQIAGRADVHFAIAKEVRGDRTLTLITPLAEGARVEEVARLLAGDTIGESARANARELLAGKL